jgi:glycosyltransferase involved in cell wall biosynthesis
MDTPLIIGFDAKRIVSNTTGLGSYGRTLINALAEADHTGCNFRLYAPDSGRDDLRQQVINSERIRFVYPLSATHRITKDLWRQRGIVKDLIKDGVTLFHGLSGELPIGIHKSGIRSIVTIHDLIFMRHPEYYHWIDAKLYARKFHRTCHEADRIIAISECTKRDIVELGGVDPSKIDIIYQSCGKSFHNHTDKEYNVQVRAHYRLPERYILNVGTIERRKNVLLAVQALTLLPQDIHLVIVGRATDYAREIKEFVAKNRLQERVLMLHNVPNTDLPAIYHMAEAFVYPSRYEGFGIPIIEAIQSRLPVVACTGSCLEEAGGPHSLYVDPDDVDGMAHAISQLTVGAEGREQRILQSMEYVHRFENNNVARQVIDSYQRLLAK